MHSRCVLLDSDGSKPMQPPRGALFRKQKLVLAAPPKMLRNQFRRMSGAEVGRIMKVGRLAEGTVSVLRNDETDILSGTSPKPGVLRRHPDETRALEREPVRCENQLPPTRPTPSTCFQLASNSTLALSKVAT